MCGIAGLYDPRLPEAALGTAVDALLSAMVHRGPDDRGVHVPPGEGLAIGMVRLSIIDLVTGHQPLVVDGGSLAFVFNGELYNYRELKAELASGGLRFDTQSDTEVALRGLQAWGPDEALERFDGMFAFCLHDRRRRTLLLARDRYGEKPLFYVWDGGRFAFCSELHPLVRLGHTSRRLHPAGLRRYLSYQFNDAPEALVEGASRLLPGHLLTLRLGEGGVATPDGRRTLGDVRPGDARPRLANRRYFDPRTLCPPPDQVDAEAPLAAQQQVKSLIEASVASRMIADVPVGVFLSGGLDSTIVAYEASRLNPRIHTFSIGFEEARFNETEYSRRAAAFLGTTHEEFVFTENEFHDGLLALAGTLSEPLADAAAVPTALLALRAREVVKVVLSGEGGDEIFGGYDYYHDRFPLGPAPPGDTKAAFSGFPLAFRGRDLDRLLVDSGGHDGGDLGGPDGDGDLLAIHGGPGSARPGNRDIMNALQTYDLLHWLPGDLLVKLDAATMAHSLEGRAPYLNRDLHQRVFSLPHHLRAKNGTAKYLLKLLYAPLLPGSIVFRAKQGFNLPVGAWLRTGRLRDLARGAVERLVGTRRFRPAPLRELLEAHLGGRRNHERRLLGIISLALWMDRNGVA
jgi:asparagine synthase (glutamine-hydrolysing)